MRRNRKTVASKLLRLKRALRLVWDGAPRWMVARGALVVVQSVLPVLSLYLMKLIVDAVAAGIAAQDKVIAYRHVALLIGVTGAVTLLTALANALASLVSEVQGMAVTEHLQHRLHAKSIEVDLEYFEDSRYQDTLHRAQQEASYRPTRVVNNLIQIGQSVVSLVALGGLMVWVHWGVTLAIFASALPALILRVRHSRRMYHWQRKVTLTERQAWHYSWMLTSLANAKEIRLFGLGGHFIDRFLSLRAQIFRERITLSVRARAGELAGQVAATLVVYGTFAFAAYATVQGFLTLGSLILYYQAFQRGQTALRDLSAGLGGLYEDNLFLINLYEFLDLQPKIAVPSEPLPVPRPLQAGIAFDRVSFQYPGSARKALEEVSFVVRPGEKVALVGKNGSGKTTLIKLLCRLYEPTGGRIAIDGVELTQFDPTELRREISVVFQDYVQYHLSAWENIWFGNVELPPERQQIEATARHVGADAAISRLPCGYDTTLGKWFGEGEELSVGEWQKIALARAFLRDAQILVLDEPTSAMDAQAEFEVFEKFHELADNATAILISHRLSTVRMADRIYVLEGGRIVESGTHDELVARQGAYAGLFEAQAQSYR